MDDVHMGEIVRQARIDAQVSQQELGERLGVGQRQISKYEQAANLTTDTLQRIARALGVTFEIGPP